VLVTKERLNRDVQQKSERDRESVSAHRVPTERREGEDAAHLKTFVERSMAAAVRVVLWGENRTKRERERLRENAGLSEWRRLMRESI
jgi:hypothetical protein